MTPGRVVVAAGSVLVAVLLQVTLLSRLGLPGASPNLVLVLAVAYGFVRGPAAGAVVGFAAGLLLDLMPTSLGYFGLTALLLALAGFVAGVVSERTGGVVTIALVSVALLAIGYVVGRAAVATLLGDMRVTWGDVPVLALTEAVYAALLATLVIPALAAVERMMEPRAFP